MIILLSNSNSNANVNVNMMDDSYRTINHLMDHVERNHNRFFCTACVTARQVFIHERDTYTKVDCDIAIVSHEKRLTFVGWYECRVA
jgi:hypothetical protein